MAVTTALAQDEGDTANRILAVIEDHRFGFADEEELQRAIAAALTADGLEVQREVRLNSRDRIDLIVAGVGIEIKVAGTTESVARQLRRYSASPLIKELILITTRAVHMRMPRDAGGKRVIVKRLGGLR